VGAARERLAAIALNESGTLVTPPARAAIEALKDRIVGYVTNAVAVSRSDEAPEAIQRRLSAQGGAIEDRRDFSASGARDMHGASLSYEVATPADHPSLLAVVARFGIMCGEDSLFFLFEGSGGRFRPVIIRRSPPFREINGAWEDLRYALSPPDRRHGWYVAIAHTPPWCQSVWRNLRYDLARPGASPHRPSVFFSEVVSHNIDSNIPYTIRAEPDRLQIEHDGGTVDPLLNRRRRVETYAIEQNGVRRIQPVALNVRDFVDEWVASPWREARSWSSAARGLAEAHREIQRDLNSGPGSSVFGSIRRCASALHEVVLGPDPVDPEAARAPRWYFTVAGTGPYRIQRVARTAIDGCSGPDIREEIEAESRRRMGFAPTA
jgi:hypothetical protein